ncbi:MAG TPA: molybdopterin-dependent oxidoreductase [Candidatus Solibacter sp.]|jgi:DMSO/TMAO reductase YedYZ molybdopterin-dependent catalytic subunit|nr:molybdopterin-dependent oxidoreductase [Candidatus Solibacter sp.]
MAERRAALRRGLLAGTFAGVVMTLFFLLLRITIGVPLLGELLPDRLLPYLDAQTFLRVLGILGATTSKEVAYITEFPVMVLAGAAYGAYFTRRQRRGWFLAVSVLVAWGVTTLGLYAVLEANYRGVGGGTAATINAIALLAAFALFAWVLWLTSRGLESAALPAEPEPQPGMQRRSFLLGGAVAVLALANGALIGLLFRDGAFGYDGTVTYPPVDPVTPIDKWYAVTKNLIDPSVDTSTWRLTVDGMVDNPRTYDLAALRAMPAVEQLTTLECISNSIGRGLISNAVWKGPRLRDLITPSQAQGSAAHVIFHAADGYTHSAPLGKAMQETTLVAYEMNGAPLIDRHGAPARIIIPGYYGEVHVKWLTRVTLVAQTEPGYYERQGWDPYYEHTVARIDSPAARSVVRLGGQPVVPVHGIAFAGVRGISRVEVSTDGGLTWSDARIDFGPSKLAWVLWSLDWTASPGDYKLVARATDGNGQPQEITSHGTVPGGASGPHRISVSVVA